MPKKKLKIKQNRDPTEKAEKKTNNTGVKMKRRKASVHE
jgi:hypothetical protein